MSAVAARHTALWDARARDLYEVLRTGDADHQAWLKARIAAWCAHQALRESLE